MEAIPIIPPLNEEIVLAVKNRELTFSSVVIHHTKTFNRPEDENHRMRMVREHLLERLGCLVSNEVLPLREVLCDPSELETKIKGVAYLKVVDKGDTV